MLKDGRALPDERLTHLIIKAFFAVYNKLGYGFLEAPYVLAFEREARKLGLRVERQLGVQLYYDGEALTYYRMDLVIECRVIVEIKAGERLHPKAKRQLYNYLRATNIEIGLLCFFGPDPEFHRLYCANTKDQSAAP